jgi:hypothetical protein
LFFSKRKFYGFHGFYGRSKFLLVAFWKVRRRLGRAVPSLRQWGSRRLKPAGAH